MYNAKRFDCNLKAYPTLVRIDAHCQHYKPIIKAYPTEASQKVNS